MDVKDIENSNKIKKVKDLKDAKDDLQMLDEMLRDSQKFRQQSNSVYQRIVDNPEYSEYIAIARITNNLRYGNIPFEKISDYVSRRKIISMLRQAVKAYIDAEILKEIAK